MLKHLLATIVVQLNVSQFGHNVGQQFNSVFQMAKVNMRSVEVRIVHSGNKMATAPHVDLDGVGEDVEADSPPEGEDHGDDDRGVIVLKELVRKYRKNKELSERSSSGQSTAKASQSTITTFDLMRQNFI